MPHFDLIQLVLLCVAAFFVGLSKGGLSTAAAISVPLLAIFMDPIQAAALLLPVYIITDWIAVWLYRRTFSARNLKILLPPILLGIVLAMFLAPYTPESLLLIVTSLIGLWFCLKTWLGKKQSEGVPAKVIPGVLWGTIAGMTTFITHSGGPPLQAFLLPQRLPKLVFAGTISFCFAVCNLAKLPAYAWLGKLNDLNWQLTLMLLAVGIVGTRVGRRLAIIMPEHVYRRCIEIMLFTLSWVLIAKAVFMIYES